MLILISLFGAMICVMTMGIALIGRHFGIVPNKDVKTALIIGAVGLLCAVLKIHVGTSIAVVMVIRHVRLVARYFGSDEVTD